MERVGQEARMNDAFFRRLRTIVEERIGPRPFPTHDMGHVLRVEKNARILAAEENARVEIPAAAAILHELFNYPKDHPESSRSGDICAEHAAIVLRDEACDADLIEPICACIRSHAFSKGAVPDSLEGKILQDADRLDAIGAIGISRCLATCSDLRRPFYSPIDPFCRDREPDDKSWGIDHVFKKLFRIPERLHTKAARRMAESRIAFLHAYLAALESEITT
jgi:uncharacterized protein